MKAAISSQNGNPLALILGGAGAVGSYLCDSLIAQGCRVICLDQFDVLKENNISHLLGGRNFEATEKITRIEEEVNYVFCLTSDWSGYLDQFSESRWLFWGQELDQNVFDQAHKRAINYRFVCADGFFGPRIDLNYPSWTTKLISDIFFRRRIRLAGDGSALVYPLFIKDLVAGLTSALFMPQSQGQIFYFAGEEITLFSFAKLWSDQFSDLEIKFDEQKSPPRINYQKEVALSQQELGWKTNFSHPEAVLATISWLNRPDVSRLLSANGFSKTKEINKKTVFVDSPSVRIDSLNKTQEEEREAEIETIEPLPPAETKTEPIEAKKFETPLLADEENNNEGLWLSRRSEPKKETEVSFSITELEIGSTTKSTKKKERKEQSKLDNNLKTKLGKGNRRWLFAGLGGLILLISLSPLLFLAKDLIFGIVHLNRAQKFCLANQLSDCQEASQVAQRHFYLAQNVSGRLAPVLAFVLGDESLSGATRVLALGQESAEAFVYFSDLAKNLEKVFRAVIGFEEVNFSDLITASQRSAQRAYFKLTNAAATGKGLPNSLVGESLDQLPTAIEATKMTLDSLPLLADFLSKDQQTIILLLQNNMELRPTGGFIGSLGIMNFQSGRLIDFSVKDVYEADGQLKGQVEPPETLERYLGEETWYLRDSNWSPDFPKTARQVLWFWEKQLDRRADGVIAINLRVVEKILSSLGGVYLPDYQETITAQNLFERAEYHSDVGFFPGSTQKKDFLGSLAFEILAEIKRRENLPASLFLAFQQSLLTGEIMIYFADSSLAEQVMTLGFDGGIKEVVCPQENCLSNYLWSVDTNVGANKANFFLKKRLVQRLGISDSQVNHSLRLTWQNTAKTEIWPAGTYRNFWRLYLPKEAVLQGAFLENNVGQRQVLDLGTDQELGKKVLSQLIEVPINSQITIEVNYQIEHQFGENRKKLAFLVQKQAGTTWDEDITLISYPNSWLPLIVSPEGEISQGAITYRNILDRNRLFEFEWGEP